MQPIWISIPLMIGILMTSGCGNDETAAQTPGAAPPPTYVRVGPIVQKMIRPELKVVATLHPRRTSIVASGANGVVEEYIPDAGMYVEEGTILSTLRMRSTDLGIAQERAILKEREEQLKSLEAGSRPQEIEEAQAKLMAFQIARRVADQKFTRVEELFKKNAINKDERDDAQERSEAAEHLYAASKAAFDLVKQGPRQEDIEQARARVLAQKENIDYLLSERDKRITKAPFDGVIVETHSFVGQWLGQGDPIITLARMDLMVVIANVDQSMLQYITLGDKVNIQVPGTEQKQWEGQIASIVSQSNWESGSRLFPIRILVENKFQEVEGRKIPILKEGMHAEVVFRGPEVEAVLVHKDALVRTSGGKAIFVYEPTPDDPKNGTVKQYQIETDIGEKEMIRIYTPGEDLTGGQVVLEGAERLRPFQNVAILPENPTAESPASEAGPTGQDSATDINPANSPEEATSKETTDVTKEASPELEASTSAK
ncbi:efflux RND transporter periplasmic adaptor subunit [Polystyrenella longa]|nr:efflux RND transporter periplasmic adaptor subunit [Polystyrenella longa]